MKKKPIEVVPYDPKWPEQFVIEANKIKEVLRENCLAIHHVGSTSILGLSAKKILDIIVVAASPQKAKTTLEHIGFRYKGEYNIPGRMVLDRKLPPEIHIHLYEEGNAEIELNLCFRDYLRKSPEALEEYASLKQKLLSDENSYIQQEGQVFTGYNLGKDAFIRDVLRKVGFDGIRFLKCTHYAEWEAAKNMRQKYFFDKNNIEDPYEWTFNHKDHVHLILCKGIEIVGYSHIQLWPEARAAMRIIVIDDKYRNEGLGNKFLKLCENWLKSQNYISLHVESSPEALAFYKKHKYVDMPFDDPDNYPSDPTDTMLGKVL